MSELIEINGPFGSYVWGTFGAVLNSAIRNENIPLSKAEDLILLKYDQREGGTIAYRKESNIVARFKWVEGISYPIFSWMGEEFSLYNQHSFVMQKDDTLKPKFRLSFCCHGTPAFQISGEQATPELHQFLHRMLTNWTKDPCYEIHQNAGAFFQGGSHDPDGQFIMIEFWKPAGAEAFMKYLNENYVVGKPST